MLVSVLLVLLNTSVANPMVSRSPGIFNNEPGPIKVSGSRFQSRKRDQCYQITQVARSSPSQSWEDCIMSIAEVPEFFQILEVVIA
jgi:hypothetical protein